MYNMYIVGDCFFPQSRHLNQMMNNVCKNAAQLWFVCLHDTRGKCFVQWVFRFLTVMFMLTK